VKPHGLRIGFALLVLVSGFACQREQDRTCVELGRQYVEKPGRDLSNVATESFFSPAFDACIHSEVAKVGVQFDIVDLSQSIIRTGNRLLHCDVNGADSVILDSVRRHRGLVMSIPCKDWLDDGFGGPPRTLKTPDRPYTRADCERVFQKWMALLKE
jgi:hypothetical protein